MTELAVDECLWREYERQREPEPNLMGLTKHSARSRCLVADFPFFSVSGVNCKCRKADDTILNLRFELRGVAFFR